VAGAGVRGMGERAVLVGATLELSPSAGGGTSVRLRLP
jgi:two-component system sensor histidine kinase UhpB